MTSELFEVSYTLGGDSLESLDHSSSFMMTLSPSSTTFVIFFSYHWLFNDATSFVNDPLVFKYSSLEFTVGYYRHITYTLKTRDPIGSKKCGNIQNQTNSTHFSDPTGSLALTFLINVLVIGHWSPFC